VSEQPRVESIDISNEAALSSNCCARGAKLPGRVCQIFMTIL